MDMLSCLSFAWSGVRISLVTGSAAGGRAARDVVSALFVRIALRVVAAVCVDEFQ